MRTVTAVSRTVNLFFADFLVVSDFVLCTPFVLPHPTAFCYLLPIFFLAKQTGNFFFR